MCYGPAVHRGFKFRLKPTPDQAETLGQWAGVTRLVYNLALEQRRDFWRQYRTTAGKHLSWTQQSLEVTELRREYDFIAALPRCVLEQALRDLDRAFQSFFAGRASYPTWRVSGQHDGIRLQGVSIGRRDINARWAEVRLPHIGWVRYRRSRDLVGQMMNATVCRSGGEWSVAFTCDIGAAPAALSPLPAIGVDRGVSNTLALSTGEVVRLADMTRLEHRRRQAQRVLARRKKGSRRYAKQRSRIARLHQKVARVRAHALHVTSTAISRRFGVVALEALNVSGMTARATGKCVRQKAGLNRSILAQGWTRFAELLEYKLEAAGGRLIYVPAAFTSQTCSACGVVDAQSRKSQAVFACVHCGHEAHADTNAALEIRRRSTALLLAEGGHLGRPVEPRTLAA